MIKKISMLLFAAVITFSLFNTKTLYAAASDIDGPEVIHKEMDQVFTVFDLLNLYDHDVFIETDGYTGYGNIPGEYTIVLTQGSLTKDVTIVVIRNFGDLSQSNDVLFVADYKDIYVSNDRILTLWEIVNEIYAATGYIDNNYKFRYEELLNEYHTAEIEDDAIAEGDYELTFRLTYYSGEQSTYSALIHAVELPELQGIVLEPPPSTMDQILDAWWIFLIGGGLIYYLTHRKKKRGYNYD